jgi:Transposase IS116/IS110/IS902 family
MPGWHCAVSCARSWGGSGPGRSACSRSWTARSRSRSWSATRAPPTRAAWASSAWPGFLARQRYSGGQKPAGLIAKLKRAPEGRVGEAELAARRALVLGLVTAIKALVEQIKQLTEQIDAALREHPDGEIFLSLFRTPGSVVTAAELLAEIGDCRARYPTRDTLAADAGQAAVAIESGKRKTACFRWGCDKRLRGAFCTLADSTRHWHPWAHDRYAAARASGHDHPRALRTLGRAWCRVVWRCWQDRLPTTPPNTAPCNSTARSPSPPRRAPCPTSQPPSGCSAPPSPNRRPAGPSAKRLTASRHPLSPLEVDTGRLLCDCHGHSDSAGRAPRLRGYGGARVRGGADRQRATRDWRISGLLPRARRALPSCSRGHLPPTAPARTVYAESGHADRDSGARDCCCFVKPGASL